MALRATPPGATALGGFAVYASDVYGSGAIGGQSVSENSSYCQSCLNNLRDDPETADHYWTLAEAAMFAYMQRDEAKIARRLARIHLMLQEHPQKLCPRHAH